MLWSWQHGVGFYRGLALLVAAAGVVVVVVSAAACGGGVGSSQPSLPGVSEPEGGVWVIGQGSVTVEPGLGADRAGCRGPGRHGRSSTRTSGGSYGRGRGRGGTAWGREH